MGVIPLGERLLVEKIWPAPVASIVSEATLLTQLLNQLNKSKVNYLSYGAWGSPRICAMGPSANILLPQGAALT